MFCGQCGGKNRDDATFCAHCGKPLGQTKPMENNQSSAQSQVQTSVQESTQPLVNPNFVQGQPVNYNIVGTMPSVENLKAPVDFLEAYKKCMRKYTTFSGRASRSEYWKFSVVYGLITSLITLFFAILGALTSSMAVSIVGYVITGLVGLGHFIPGLAVLVRRLHDIGKSGWYILLPAIPLIGSIWLLIYLIKKGEPVDNQYGLALDLVFTEEEQKLAKKQTIIAVVSIVACYILIPIIGAASMVSSFENMSKPSSTATSTTMPTPTPEDSNVAIANEAKGYLVGYFDALTARDFMKAYAMLTSRKQGELGSFETWKHGYDTSISSRIIDAKPQSVSPDHVVFEFQLESRDRENGRVKVQNFAGTIVMVKQGSIWLLDDMTANVTGSHVE